MVRPKEFESLSAGIEMFLRDLINPYIKMLY